MTVTVQIFFKIVPETSCVLSKLNETKCSQNSNISTLFKTSKSHSGEAIHKHFLSFPSTNETKDRTKHGSQWILNMKLLPKPTKSWTKNHIGKYIGNCTCFFLDYLYAHDFFCVVYCVGTSFMKLLCCKTAVLMCLWPLKQNLWIAP